MKSKILALLICGCLAVTVFPASPFYSHNIFWLPRFVRGSAYGWVSENPERELSPMKKYIVHGGIGIAVSLLLACVRFFGGESKSAADVMRAASDDQE